ncbi:hypothetical protein HDV00_002862 [Rhizophlyctis rosea]|nr:hypothetical protein HDV00_002862 [Rhizophlyctis rosea]
MQMSSTGEPPKKKRQLVYQLDLLKIKVNEYETQETAWKKDYKEWESKDQEYQGIIRSLRRTNGDLKQENNQRKASRHPKTNTAIKQMNQTIVRSICERVSRERVGKEPGDSHRGALTDLALLGRKTFDGKEGGDPAFHTDILRFATSYVDTYRNPRNAADRERLIRKTVNCAYDQGPNMYAEQSYEGNAMHNTNPDTMGLYCLTEGQAVFAQALEAMDQRLVQQYQRSTQAESVNRRRQWLP